MNSHQVLFISNGHGEDLMAARIALQLRSQDPTVSIAALPIVGLGSTYQAAGIPLLLSGATMPSGGFIRNGFKNLFMDIRAGLLGLTGKQIKVLKAAREDTALAVCVGDVLTLILAAWFVRRPIVFLPTAKSDYIAPHWPIEMKLIKRYSTIVFPRDQVTADSLCHHGIPAVFPGNVMMDCLDFQGEDLAGLADEWIVGILPGGRSEAYENMKDIAAVVTEFERLVKAQVPERSIRYLAALSNGLSYPDLVKTMESSGWKSVERETADRKRGIVGYLMPCEPAGSSIRLIVTQGRFADVIKASQIIIGLAGTANEQAVGLGKPVVTFAGRGPQFTPKFVAIQKKLLGDSISVVPPDPEMVAQELFNIVTDPARQVKMAKIGRERMGEPGGAERIAEVIDRLIDNVQLTIDN